MHAEVGPGTLVASALDALLTSADEPSRSLERIVSLVCRSGLSDQAHLYVVDADDVHLRLAAVAAVLPDAAAALRSVMAGTAVRIDSSLPGRASRSSDPIVLNDLAQLDLPIPEDFRRHIDAYDVRHMVAVQVPGQGRTVGALVASRCGERPPFGPDEVALLAQVAAVSAYALDRVALLGRVARQADILDRVGDAVVAVDENRIVTKWNRAAESLYGIPREQALGSRLGDLFTTVSYGSSDLDTAWTGLRSAPAWRDAVRQVTRDGRVVEVDALVTSLEDDASGFSGAVAVNRDVSELLRSQREIAERQAFAEAVLDTLPGRTVVVGEDGRVRAVDARYEKEGPFGDGPGSGPDVGADLLAFLDLLSHAMVGAGVLAREVRATLAGDDGDTTVDVLGLDGRWTAAQTARFRGPGGGALITFVDVSERKSREVELAYQATHDSLTDLPNRALLLDRVRESLARAARRGHRVAVMFVDLDGLKAVNDRDGHAAGDAMLVAAARRLESSCRVIDTVARLGGDEFVVLLDEVDGTQEAQVLADRMHAALQDPSAADDVGPLSASIGVALADGIAAPTETDAADLVGHSDAAMLVAKRSGKGQVVLMTRALPGSRQPQD
jgi:diguanylate cyclase (GGDEF)-like protein/PAS domain S-box-containing protein